MIERMSAVALAAALAVGCGGSDGPTTPPPPPPPPPSAITVTTGSAPPARFIPTLGTVAVGGEVTFTNGSPVEHDVTTGSNAWDATVLQPGESFSVTFDQAGEYPYLCTLHAGMTGRIVVQ